MADIIFEEVEGVLPISVLVPVPDTLTADEYTLVKKTLRVEDFDTEIAVLQEQIDAIKKNQGFWAEAITAGNNQIAEIGKEIDKTNLRKQKFINTIS